MCDFEAHYRVPPPLAEDEYVSTRPGRADSSVTCASESGAQPRRSGACQLISPQFAGLLADSEWLPDTYRVPS
jgi:hypothetical protein